jgi:curved DNA-binding protein CbpA
MTRGMKNFIKKFRRGLSGFALAAVLGACAAQPMTKNVINDIGGLVDINRFQYYISADIRLTATERIREPDFDKRGGASVRETAFRDVVIISKNTMGVLMDSRVDEEDGLLTLEICFEEKAVDSAKRITFKQEGPGLEHKFYVVYSDPRRRIMKYGETEYGLETNTGERAYLNIRINKSRIEKERIRRVKGRRVEY